MRAMASSTAASEPGQGDIHQSAIDAVFDNRVSSTQTRAPRVPRDALPLAGATLARAPHRITDALGIVDLVERGRALGAVAAAAAGMDGIALELLDSARGLVDVGEQPARRLAVEADGRNQ